MSLVKRVLSRVHGAVRTPDYLKRQTFVVRYQVMVKNVADKPNEISVIVPVPLTNEYQRVASEPHFTPATVILATEGRFGNRYATWKVKLASGESRLFTEHFTISREPVQIEIPDSLLVAGHGEREAVYGAASEHVQIDDAQIQSLAKEAVAGATNIKTLVSRVNEFVIKRLEYGNPIKGLYSALDAVKQVKVDCGGYDSLFVALCIASGVPARIVSGFWAGYAHNDMHAWAEVQLPNQQWVPVDPSTESLVRQKRTQKYGRLGKIGSDRIAFSVGCDLILELPKKIVRTDILQHPCIDASLGERSFVSETRVETIKA